MNSKYATPVATTPKYATTSQPPALVAGGPERNHATGSANAAAQENTHSVTTGTGTSTTTRLLTMAYTA